tara:strand:+ start:1561 stop:2439 length:879 start_codon:yes stop_codon:yes gene_type:complete
MIKLLLILFLLFSNIVKAADSLLTIKQQVDRLQRDVNDLSKLVFTNNKDEVNQSEPTLNENSGITAFDLRIYDLEKDLKNLNNNFEELIFKIDDLNNLYKKLSLEISSLLINKNENNNNDSNNKISTLENNIEIKEENILGNIVINSEDLTDKKSKIKEKEKNILLSPEEEFQKAFDLLRGQEFDNAKIALQNFIKNYQNNQLAGSAHYWLGEVYILKKEYREAAIILAEGYQNYPTSLKAPDMLYKLSESFILIDKKIDACNTLKKFSKEFTEHKLFKKVEDKIISLDCPI